MSDQSAPQNHTLAEISHLFLSAVRDRTGNGGARPQRTPPKPAISVDLTPEEFAQVAGGDDQAANDRGAGPIGHVTAVLAGHLNGKQFDRVKDYARHLAAAGSSVGLIEVDASEFRVTCFDKLSEATSDAAPLESFDPRQMNEVLEELSWDVQRWLLVLPTPRVPEARTLLRDVDHWLLLSTCDHDGVIACYRTLKGMTDLWPEERADRKPRLSLALLDAPDEAQAQRISSKLVSVCQQFLNWPLESEPLVRADEQVSEHLVMSCRPLHDKSQIAAAPHWQILSDFVARSKRSAEPTTPASSAAPPRIDATQSSTSTTNITMPHLHLTRAATDADTTDVIDLPADTSENGIIDAVLRHCSSELVECPIAPPMCASARLAVSRDRRVVMLAVARQGLADLSSIGRAYQWLQENHNLISMAVPQLAIDPQQTPHLSLLINQTDSAAQTLGPMLQVEHVTVQTYRKLRWGGKTGLLLDAA